MLPCQNGKHNLILSLKNKTEAGSRNAALQDSYTFCLLYKILISLTILGIFKENGFKKQTNKKPLYIFFLCLPEILNN